jgi:hypothetical protein
MKIPLDFKSLADRRRYMSTGQKLIRTKATVKKSSLPSREFVAIFAGSTELHRSLQAQGALRIQKTL